MSLRTSSVMLIMILVCPAAAACFDGERQGFLVSAGLGASIGQYRQDVHVGGLFGTGGEENHPGFVTDLKVGNGTNDKTLVYLHSSSSWFHIDSAAGKRVLIWSQIVGLGLRYYLDEHEPMFVHGTAGVAVWTAPFEDSGKPWAGLGLLGGLGVELSRHTAIEISLGFGKPQWSDNSTSVAMRNVIVQITLMAMAM